MILWGVSGEFHPLRVPHFPSRLVERVSPPQQRFLLCYGGRLLVRADHGQAPDAAPAYNVPRGRRTPHGLNTVTSRPDSPLCLWADHERDNSKAQVGCGSDLRGSGGVRGNYQNSACVSPALRAEKNKNWDQATLRRSSQSATLSGS